MLALARVVSADVINTDRPNFANSTSIVEPGSLQWESGVSRQESQDANGTKTWLTQTPLLLRAGWLPNLEGRFGWDGYEWSRVGNDAADGAGDLNLGVKWKHRQQTGAMPAIASLLSIAIPSGARNVRHVGYRPGWQLPLDWSLPADFTWTVMPGITYDTTDENKRFWDPVLGTVLNYGWTPRLQTFVEWADQQWAPVVDGGVIQTFDFGATWQILRDLQLDGAVWYGLNRNSPVMYWTVGLSTRRLNLWHRHS
jgi:hypothetical protein